MTAKKLHNAITEELKVFISIAACALGAAIASGFDSEAWLARCAEVDAEARRMRGAWSNCTARATSPAENIVVPLEFHPDGSPKFTLRAAEAQMFLESGLVWARGAEALMYNARGVVEGRATVSSCVVDLNAKSGWAEGPVVVSYGGCTVEGSGLYVSQSDGFCRVYDGVSMRAEWQAGDVKALKPVFGAKAEGRPEKKKGAKK